MKLWSQTSLMGLLAGACGIVGACVGGCTRHTVDVQPIKIEPIYMQLDINIKVDRELDEFFDFEDEMVVPQTQATQPATLPATVGIEGGAP